MLLLLAIVRFTFLKGNTYYIRQQAIPVSWQKPEKLGFEHPQTQPALSWLTYFCVFKIFTEMGKVLLIQELWKKLSSNVRKNIYF